MLKIVSNKTKNISFIANRNRKCFACGLDIATYMREKIGKVYRRVTRTRTSSANHAYYCAECKSEIFDGVKRK